MAPSDVVIYDDPYVTSTDDVVEDCHNAGFKARVSLFVAAARHAEFRFHRELLTGC